MEKDDLEIGIIGMGDMGRMYAHKLAAAGWKHVNVCDRPEEYERLREDLQGTGLNVLRDGHQVARRSDFTMYSVESGHIDKVVAQYGASHKLGSIVGGQTSVKAPERAAFEAYLPPDVHIVSCHSLHGPQIDSNGQPLVLIQHRAAEDILHVVERILACLESRYVYMSYEEHDVVTANTQAVTHAAFLTMGTAWSESKEYPWETGRHPGGIEMVKIYLCLRIYGAKSHVYAGLALLNPAARIQVTQYAASSSDLFKLMLTSQYDALVERVFAARRSVFGWADDEVGGADGTGRPMLMTDEMLDEFYVIAQRVTRGEQAGKEAAEAVKTLHAPPNSHLSLLAIADCWHVLGVDPYRHLELAATPVFRMWIGVTQYMFQSPQRLLDACRAAIKDTRFRTDDLEFVIAARGWAQAVQFGDFDAYKRRFEQPHAFFKPRLAEAHKVGAEMLKELSHTR
ncbi:prephenate dehydrogenase (NADP(+)) [Malassezia vespertilionis]|uniref:Tyr1p n=1 Tax=Malassezia vespertilionis TaxID=2020962 RepID=A0A2N1JBG6_9BASI|nr:prephenate dehydrogenase (NADP(+)) [Malassezia vespertilionis]PKI83893.1 Tyr1p [Malassezia vespertilionis]WFD07037.1 prephenate dehydrogenase (NADP(+)) [Malassezia vespertilionis]